MSTKANANTIPDEEVVKLVNVMTAYIESKPLRYQKVITTFNINHCVETLETVPNYRWKLNNLFCIIIKLLKR